MNILRPMAFSYLLLLATGYQASAMTQEKYDKAAQKAEEQSRTLQEQIPKTKIASPECTQAWAKSSAAQTCTTNELIEQNPTGTCNIYATCLRTDYAPRKPPDNIKQSVEAPSWQYDEKGRTTQYFPAALSHTQKLVNCNGDLKFFSCN